MTVKKANAAKTSTVFSYSTYTDVDDLPSRSSNVADRGGNTSRYGEYSIKSSRSVTNNVVHSVEDSVEWLLQDVIGYFSV